MAVPWMVAERPVHPERTAVFLTTNGPIVVIYRLLACFLRADWLSLHVATARG